MFYMDTHSQVSTMVDAHDKWDKNFISPTGVQVYSFPILCV